MAARVGHGGDVALIRLTATGAAAGTGNLRVPRKIRPLKKTRIKMYAIVPGRQS